LLNKKTLLEISVIILIVICVGIIYNVSSPNRLPFIGEEKQIDFSQSDSLLSALRIEDSLQRIADSLKQLSTHQEDSISLLHEQKIQDSLQAVIKKDSIQRVNDSLKTSKKRIADSIANIKNEQNFVKPVDIRLDFAKALFDKKYTFIDARDEADYKESTIKGAINIPYHQLDENKAKLEKMPKDRVYVCFCSSACDVSIDLAYAMAHMGFTHVYIFHGGWDEWKKAGYPMN
jgi:rhodanese-related sulfurtransferase